MKNRFEGVSGKFAIVALVVGAVSSASAIPEFDPKDSIDTNLTVAAAANLVENAVLRGESVSAADRVRVLRLASELDRYYYRGRLPVARLRPWMTAGITGADEKERLARVAFACSRLFKFCGILFSDAGYLARGRTEEACQFAEYGELTPIGASPEIAAYEKLMAENRRDLAAEVRPGRENAGAFWNGNARLFIYPPSFAFGRVAGAARYRFSVTDDMLQDHVFEADSPEVSLGPVWAALPVGITRVRCRGLAADGTVLAESGSRIFWRAAPFDPAEYAKPKRPWREACEKAIHHLLGWPEVSYLLEHGHPDPAGLTNFESYPSKMQSAVIQLALIAAERHPGLREKALRVARTSAEYLLSTREPEGTPLAGFPQTYVGEGQRSADFGGQHMLVYPAQAGEAFLRMWKATGERKYRDAAVAIADRYLALQLEDGTWYLKLRSKDGGAVSPNRLVQPCVSIFLENVFAETGRDAYRAAADRAFAAIDRGALVDWNWEGQFEDIDPSKKRYDNLTKHNACDTALYLLKRYPGDARRLAQARDIIRFAEDQFVMWRPPCRPDGTGLWAPTYRFLAWRTPTVLEQYHCYSPIDASAAKLMRVYLALHRAEGRALDRAKAEALAASMINNQDDSGRIRTYWIPEPGDACEDAGTIRVPYGGDWFNCMTADVCALSEL